MNEHVARAAISIVTQRGNELMGRLAKVARRAAEMYPDEFGREVEQILDELDELREWSKYLQRETEE